MLDNNIKLGLLILVIIALFGCNSKETNRGGSRNEGYAVVVQKSSGSNFGVERENISYKFKPCPANLVRFRNKGLQELSCLLIGDNVDKRTKLNVLPIACIELFEFEQPKEYFIVIPSMEAKSGERVMDYHSFVALDYQTKNAIEYWLLNRYGVGNTRLKRWLDTDKTSMILEANWKD